MFVPQGLTVYKWSTAVLCCAAVVAAVWMELCDMFVSGLAIY